MKKAKPAVSAPRRGYKWRATELFHDVKYYAYQLSKGERYRAPPL